MKYVLIGKIVNTHGLKGEVRILSSFKYKDRIFKKGMKVYIGKDKVCEEINSYRYHKIFDMITMNGYNDINQILKYKGEYIFVNKEDIKLEDNEYLYSDSCIVEEVNFNCDLRPSECTAKFRYRQKDNEVKIEYLDNGELLVRYNNVKSVTPGQACVFYVGDKCIGGGIIKEVRKNEEKLWYLL